MSVTENGVLMPYLVPYSVISKNVDVQKGHWKLQNHCHFSVQCTKQAHIAASVLGVQISCGQKHVSKKEQEKSDFLLRCSFFLMSEICRHPWNPPT